LKKETLWAGYGANGKDKPCYRGAVFDALGREGGREGGYTPPSLPPFFLAGLQCVVNSYVRSFLACGGEAGRRRGGGGECVCVSCVFTIPELKSILVIAS